MIIATKIRFNQNDSEKLETIVDIYLRSAFEGYNGWYKKEEVYNLLKKGGVIKIDIAPYSELEPAERNGVKYVRAKSDSTEKNNLLELEHQFKINYF